MTAPAPAKAPSAKRTKKVVESEGIAEIVTTRDLAQPPPKVTAADSMNSSSAKRRRDIGSGPPGRIRANV